MGKRTKLYDWSRSRNHEQPYSTEATATLSRLLCPSGEPVRLQHFNTSIPLKPSSTPGKELEIYWNAHYGPGNAIYEDLCALTRQGLRENWIANIKISGPDYRRSKVALPKEDI